MMLWQSRNCTPTVFTVAADKTLDIGEVSLR